MSEKDSYSTSAEVNAAIRQFEVQAVNFAYRFIKDSKVRVRYMADTKTMSLQLVEAYQQGQITPKQAATTANQMRNQIMEFARVNSSDMGRAKARALKAKGLDLDYLTRHYAKKIFKSEFSNLSTGNQDEVYLAIVESSGRSRPAVNAKTRRLGQLGRGLWLLTACVAVYNVSTAQNKVKATGREAANIGGGFAGGAVAGATAGIWLGPVGVAVGVIVGGTLGAIIADSVYVELAGPDGEFVRWFLPRFTSFIGTDEAAIADALIRECGYELDKVYGVFIELNDKYSTDADDIALLYIQKIKSLQFGPIKEAFKLHTALKKLLRDTLQSGWTSAAEKQAIAYLQSL